MQWQWQIIMQSPLPPPPPPMSRPVMNLFLFRASRHLSFGAVLLWQLQFGHVSNFRMEKVCGGADCSCFAGGRMRTRRAHSSKIIFSQQRRSNERF